MKEMNKNEQMNFFKETLLKTEREGMEDLLDFMDDLGFYTAPASGGNHLCKDGGLFEHTVNVMRLAEKSVSQCSAVPHIPKFTTA